MDEDLKNKVLKEYKEEFHISHISDDDTISRKLKESYLIIESLIGKFDMDEFPHGKELVFNRVRYALNDSLEFFDDNFRELITTASLELLMRGDTND